MATNSKIPWCHDTRNFWWGCVKWSEACEFCYAWEMDKRRGPLFDHGRRHWGPSAPRWLRVDAAVKECEQSNRLAIKSGERRRVFVNSMADTFEEHPVLGEARAVLFATIERLPDCDWLLLTKRPDNILRMVPVHWLTNWPAHVWIGTTVENQKWADVRIPQLRRVPARVRFLSIEPMLGVIDLCTVHTIGTAANAADPRQVGERWIDWVIIGGESGSPRKFNLDDARALLTHCKNTGVPVFMKQLGRQPFSFSKPEGVHSFANQNMEVPPRVEHLLVLKDRTHGADINEWPADLRVRELP